MPLDNTRPAQADTPGQVAYAAYWQVHRHDGHLHVPPPFARLLPITRQSWEAAAEAVLAMDKEKETHHERTA